MAEISSTGRAATAVVTVAITVAGPSVEVDELIEADVEGTGTPCVEVTRLVEES